MQEKKLVCLFEALIDAFKVLEKYYLSIRKTTTESFMRKTITNSRQCKKQEVKNISLSLHNEDWVKPQATRHVILKCLKSIFGNRSEN